MIDYMKEALVEAEKAAEAGEIPVGAVIVKDGEIIGRAFNMKETMKCVTAHAEILAIQQASDTLDNWRLNGCEMYVTLEPCPMCAGAILQSRISRLHIGAPQDKTGAFGSAASFGYDENLNKFLDISWEMDERCLKILRDFFKKRRRQQVTKK